VSVCHVSVCHVSVCHVSVCHVSVRPVSVRPVSVRPVSVRPEARAQRWCVGCGVLGVALPRSPDDWLTCVLRRRFGPQGRDAAFSPGINRGLTGTFGLACMLSSDSFSSGQFGRGATGTGIAVSESSLSAASERVAPDGPSSPEDLLRVVQLAQRVASLPPIPCLADARHPPAQVMPCVTGEVSSSGVMIECSTCGHRQALDSSLAEAVVQLVRTAVHVTRARPDAPPSFPLALVSEAAALLRM
jgi:hypothetical protein